MFAALVGVLQSSAPGLVVFSDIPPPLDSPVDLIKRRVAPDTHKPDRPPRRPAPDVCIPFVSVGVSVLGTSLTCAFTSRRAPQSGPRWVIGFEATPPRIMPLTWDVGRGWPALGSLGSRLQETPKARPVRTPPLTCAFVLVAGDGI